MIMTLEKHLIIHNTLWCGFGVSFITLIVVGIFSVSPFVIGVLLIFLLTNVILAFSYTIFFCIKEDNCINDSRFDVHKSDIGGASEGNGDSINQTMYNSTGKSHLFSDMEQHILQKNGNDFILDTYYSPRYSLFASNIYHTRHSDW